MSTKVLVFESDPTFASELQSGLARFDCQTALVDDANVGLQAAASDKPDLILLSIELPRMNGFSVCNKLKRDPSLKKVPLIIMSSDSTEETFEQHRRLRTRAEDYVHKPISFSDLLGRIQQFVDLAPDGKAQPEAQRISEGDAIVIDDDIEIEDAETLDDDDLATAPVSAQLLEEDQAPATSVREIDEEVETFAEQAFDALLEEGPTQGSARPSPTAPPRLVPSARPRRSSIPSRTDEGPRGGDEGRVAELQEELRVARERVAELEDAAKRGSSSDAEVQRLQRELDEAKAKAGRGGRGGGSAREFLDLRESLNKKDKEILDLRDQLTHRDKELLGLRDSSLALEREKADLTDRIAELERQVADLQKSAEALRADKEQASKRADDFRRKNEKLAGDMEARDQELAQRDARDAALRAEHQQALEAAAEAQRDALAAAEEQGRRNVVQAIAETNERAEQTLNEALSEAREQAEALRDEAMRAREEELRTDLNAKLAALHRANEDAMGKLKAEQAQLQSEAAQAAAARLEAREAELMATHSAEVQRLTEQYENQLSEFTSELASRTEERDSARSTVEELNASVVSLNASLVAAQTDLEQTRAQLEGEQSRLQKARDKWDADRTSLERAKDAMAAALAQIEEADERPFD